MRVNSLAQAGGVNSLESFARSWSRAAGFVEIPTRQPSFVISKEDEESIQPQEHSPSRTLPKSLLREQLQRAETSSTAVLDDGSKPHKQDADILRPPDRPSQATNDAKSFINRTPRSASPCAPSYGGIYGSLSPRVSTPSMQPAGEGLTKQQEQGHESLSDEQEPLLVKVVQQKDGQKLLVVVGQSTLPQTVFNSVNVLIGVGLLSLPLGLKYSGWLIGLAFFLFAAVVTRYTAGILAKCLDVNPVLIGFADVAYQAYGRNARIATGLLFTVELVAACVALVVLFADSLNDLIPGLSVVIWKVLCGIILAPLSFVPLRYLSFTSVLGILSCLGSRLRLYHFEMFLNADYLVVTLIFVDGILKAEFPGSLRDPAPMAGLLPQRWSTVPLSFGLLMCESLMIST